MKDDRLCAFNVWALFIKVTMENIQATGLLLAWSMTECNRIALKEHEY